MTRDALPDLPPGYEVRNISKDGFGQLFEIAIKGSGSTISKVMYTRGTAEVLAWADYGRRIHRAGVVKELREITEEFYDTIDNEWGRGAANNAERIKTARRALRIAEGGSE